MKPKQPTIRIDEDACSVDVAIKSNEFDQKLRNLFEEEHITLSPSTIDQVVYWREDIPPRRLWVDRIWVALTVIAGLIFLYGLYSIAEKCFIYVTS